jgi:hypothetical protein
LNLKPPIYRFIYDEFNANCINLFLAATEKTEQIYFTKLVEAPEYLLKINSDTFVTNWVRSNLELCFIDLFVTSLFVTLAEKNYENGGCAEIYMF